MTNPAFRKTKRSLPIALLRAREQVMEPIRAMLADSGVTEQKWRVLRVLEEAGEIEPTVIAREACLHLPSLSRILKTMEQDGLIQRREDEQDRRKTVIAIADAGRAILNEHAVRSAAILVDIERRLGAGKIEAMLDLLEELTDDPGGEGSEEV
ncbi:MAG: homoprotocatechuate degradation operon regulator HpaR [Pseudomonadota bacterium]|nr:homoprotocatechuate degradation operon regulator HpaR [Pseudomonadota bacterium]